MGRETTRGGNDAGTCRLALPRDEVARTLTAARDEGEALLRMVIRTENGLASLVGSYAMWKASVTRLLRNCATTAELQLAFERAIPSGCAVPASLAGRIDQCRRLLRYKTDKLRSIISQLDLYDEDTDAASRAAPPAGPPTKPVRSGSKVLLVHGQDNGRKMEVQLFLFELGLHPVVFSAPAIRGRAIQAALERHADVGFAVVLLSASDAEALTNPLNGPGPLECHDVVFDLGYLAAHLGRDRIAIVTDRGIELPEDVADMARIDWQGEWRERLPRALQAAGYKVAGK